MQNLENMGRLWQLYGFKANPFLTSALLVKGGILPLNSFVGRDNELKQLLKKFNSEGGSRTFVFGEVGVGKTTFVNFARAHMLKKGVFTPIDEIGIKSNFNPDTFILNTLSSIYITISKLPNRDNLISKETYKKLERLAEIETTRVSGGGFNILGSGVEVSRETVSTSSLSGMMLESFFKSLINEIHENTQKDVIIHYNNLERLKDSYVKEILEDLRDFFLTPYVHFVFVGNSHIWNVVQGMKRVSSIISTAPILIRTLEYKEVEEILDRRFRGLISDKTMGYIIPYNKQVLAELYDLYSGNIRDILNSLDTAVTRATVDKPIVLDKDDLAKILRQALNEDVLDKLQGRAREVLFKILEKDEITNKGIAISTGLKRPNVSGYLTDLVDVGCIELKRQNGKDKYWGVMPHIKWLNLKLDTEPRIGRQEHLAPKFVTERYSGESS